MRADLTADCGQCFGLCCVALTFAKSADFAIDKDAGEPCPNLEPDFRCGIHDRLRPAGFAGCTVYDCFGAGQKISQVTFGGRDWRTEPASAAQMFAVLPIVRQLHELLRYLSEALTLVASGSLHGELDDALAATEQLSDGSADELVALDMAPHRAMANALLQQASEVARAGIVDPAQHRGADLIGAGLRGADLRGANLRGAYLIAADLRDADLSLADVIGADCRDADLRGADLATSLFLTQSQLQAAKGDARTSVPPSLTRPAHWTSG